MVRGGYGVWCVMLGVYGVYGVWCVVRGAYGVCGLDTNSNTGHSGGFILCIERVHSASAVHAALL